MIEMMKVIVLLPDEDVHEHRDDQPEQRHREVAADRGQRALRDGAVDRGRAEHAGRR